MHCAAMLSWTQIASVHGQPWQQPAGCSSALQAIISGLQKWVLREESSALLLSPMTCRHKAACIARPCWLNVQPGRLRVTGSQQDCFDAVRSPGSCGSLQHRGRHRGLAPIPQCCLVYEGASSCTVSGPAGAWAMQQRRPPAATCTQACMVLAVFCAGLPAAQCGPAGGVSCAADVVLQQSVLNLTLVLVLLCRGIFHVLQRHFL